MIRVSDALILARTKLRTRKLRTIITTSVAGLLFAGLIATLVIVQGMASSLDNFSNEGLGKRYLLSASKFSEGDLYSTNQPVIDRAIAIQKDRIKQKTAEAKRVGIAYDASAELKVFDEYDGVRHLNVQHPAATQAITEYQQTHPLPDRLAEVQKVLADYHPKAYYQSWPLRPENGALTTMKDGKESLLSPAEKQKAQKNQAPERDGANELTLMDAGLTKPFILPGSATKKDDTAIPVIVSYAQAEKFLRLPTLPKRATTDDQVARLQQIRARAASIRFGTCYRSQTSQESIDKVFQTKQEIAANAKNADYKKPALITDLPAADSCGPVVVTRDVRSASEKTQADKEEAFAIKFGERVPIQQEKIMFRVVGLMPNPPESLPSSAFDILLIILGSRLGAGYVVPKDMYDALPAAAHYNQLFKTTSLLGDNPATVHTIYPEFSSAASARQVLRDKACSGFGDNCSGSSLIMMPFGSGTLTFAEIRNSLAQVFAIFVGITAVIALFILMSTVGRMIADGRRETAVFRAIGAKRGDIALMYGIYTFLLSLGVVVFALVIGNAIAYLADQSWWMGATMSARLAFGASDSTRQFHFFDPKSIEVLYVVGVMLLAGMLSMIPPLIRNARRNPIKDMRDDT